MTCLGCELAGPDGASGDAGDAVRSGRLHPGVPGLCGPCFEWVVLGGDVGLGSERIDLDTGEPLR